MLHKLFLTTSFIIILVASQTAFADDDRDDVMQKCQNRAPEWYQCVTDQDCTISTDPCGWPVLGVNKMHKDRSEICTRQAGAFIDCPIWKDTPENKMAVTCQQGICTAIKVSAMPSEAPIFGDTPDSPAEN